jgi:hypothetical protein
MTNLRLDLLRSLAPALLGASLLPACVVVDDPTGGDTDGDTDGTGGSGDGSDGADSSGGVPGDCAQLGQDDLAGNTTLPAGCYAVSQLLSVESRLDLEPGVEMYFAANAGLMVGGSGVLSAIGTVDLPVVMTGSAAGGWAGLRFLGAASSDNRLEQVQLDGAADIGVDVSLSSRLTVSASEVSGAPGFGLVAQAGSEVTVEGSTFAANGIPIATSIDGVVGIGSDNVFDANDEQIIQVEGGSLADTVQWASPGVPLRFTSSVTVQAALTLDAGVEIEMPMDSQFVVVTTGSISAAGRPDAPVTWRGVHNERGFWRGLSVESKATANAISGCVIENGGSDGWNGSPDSVGMVWLPDEAKLVLSGCTLRGSDGPALTSFGGADMTGFADNVIEDNQGTLRVSPAMGHMIEASNTFVGNDEQYIRIGRANANNDRVEGNSTWQALSIPYRVMDRFFVSGAWTIAAGTTVEVVQDRQIIVEDTGSVHAVGTADAPILLQGAEQLAGYWMGLQIDSVSASNEMQFVELRHAGSDGFNGAADSDGAVYLAGGSLMLTDSTIADSGGYGIVVWDDGQLLGCGNVTFSNNVKGDTFVRTNNGATSACQ